jgi:nitrite reductase/ring-hydroxylating ferredoxin subunit
MKIPALAVIALVLLSSCKKDTEGRIPDVFVDYHVTIQEFSIKSSSGVLLVNGTGVAGLIIYRRPDNNYVAFDRCSSVNPEQKCAVTPDDPSLTATDPCSGAKFSLYDGTPMKAPAKRPLKQYYVYVTNSSEIHVTNQ